MARRWILGVGGLAALLSAAGCAAQAPASPAEQMGEPTAVAEVTELPGSMEGYEGALADAEVTGCAPANDGWSVAGRVTNSAAEPREYRIYVTLLADGETAGIEHVDVPAVEPGASAEWAAELPVARDGRECVLRVERFAPR